MATIIRIDLDESKKYKNISVEEWIGLFRARAKNVLERRGFKILSEALYISASGRGFHHEILLKEDITQKQKISLRIALFDDKKRIEIDKERIRYGCAWKDILFTSKTYDGKRSERVRVF
ncbi:MAG: hypothetical protein ACE5ES_01810 [Candidatus Nanoarchaeia archaeon]